MTLVLSGTTYTDTPQIDVGTKGRELTGAAATSGGVKRALGGPHAFYRFVLTSESDSASAGKATNATNGWEIKCVLAHGAPNRRLYSVLGERAPLGVFVPPIGGDNGQVAG